MTGRIEATRQRERLARCGNGCPGSMASGVTHGEQRAPEVLVEEAALVRVQVFGPQDPDAFGGEQRLDLVEEAPVLRADQLVDALRDRGQRFARREPIRSRRRLARSRVPLEPGHADHEELVQVRAEDGEELDALEQRHRGVLGFLEHPAIELEPGQLAVDVRAGRHLAACRGNPARARRRVQLRGGARRPPARRTFCTLSGRSRAPTKQMGP